MANQVIPNPLESLDEWEDDLLERYPEEGTNKFGTEFRNYDDPARDSAREFYRQNHIHQNLKFAQDKKADFGRLNRKQMGIWEACEYLNELVDESDPEAFIECVRRFGASFGGINLEDIKSPECFEIERILKEQCDVPVFHDDQHGTAIVVGAGLINALEIQKKRIEDIKVVCVGAGAAGVASVRLLIEMGARKENILVLDRKGVIHSRRDDLNQYKAALANDTDKRTLNDAVEDADVFIGVSGPDMLTPDMVKKMAEKPIIFALANPDPEIRPEVAKAARPDAIVATGRSDFPNQVNNVLCFPYMFRGALDVRSTSITEEMKIAAVHAIAELVRTAPPQEVLDAYGGEPLTFGADYIIPKPNDPRLLGKVSAAVARAAVDCGVARKGYPSHYPLNSLDEIFPEL